MMSRGAPARITFRAGTRARYAKRLGCPQFCRTDAMKTIDEIERAHADLTSLRRDIHAHPELAFQETRTSALVAERLRSFGIEVHTGLGKTGLVGVLKSGNSGKTLGLRADMDALPMPEHNRFEHKSTIAGRMHGCGHDGHTTMLLGAAEYLSKHRNFDGTVHF